MKTSYWNHRVLAYKDHDEMYFEITEVFYDNDLPTGYGSTSIGWYSDGHKWAFEKMKAATEKPILWGGDKFPKEYKK